MAVDPAGRGRRGDARRVRRQPAVPGQRRPGRHRQHGRQGGPLRGGRRRPVHGRHDRNEHRRHQLLARQRPTDRGARPAVQHGARRGHPGRDRGRDVRDARHRGDPGRVHRRPDGRPDAGIPRQEGRILRDQDGDARRPRARCQHPRVHRDRERPACRPGGPAEPRSARLQRDPVRLLEPDGQQRLGLRRADRQHALLQHHRRSRDAHRPLRDDRPDPRAGRLDGRSSAASRRRSARSRRPGSLWVVLLIGVVIIVGALTFFPALALGPIVEQLLQNAGKVS